MRSRRPRPCGRHGDRSRCRKCDHGDRDRRRGGGRHQCEHQHDDREQSHTHRTGAAPRVEPAGFGGRRHERHVDPEFRRCLGAGEHPLRPSLRPSRRAGCARRAPQPSRYHDARLRRAPRTPVGETHAQHRLLLGPHPTFVLDHQTTEFDVEDHRIGQHRRDTSESVDRRHCVEATRAVDRWCPMPVPMADRPARLEVFVRPALVATDRVQPRRRASHDGQLEPTERLVEHDVGQARVHCRIVLSARLVERGASGRPVSVVRAASC